MANMDASWPKLLMSVEWRYIFRQAVHNLWYWRNQVAHHLVLIFPPPVHARKEILDRVNTLDIVYAQKKRDRLGDISLDV